MIPNWLREKVDNPPAAGTGVHFWLFSCARQLHAHMGEQEMVEWLMRSTRSCGRHVSHREVLDAVRNSREVAWVKGKPVTAYPPGTFSAAVIKRAERWSVPDPLLRKMRIFDGGHEGIEGVDDLWQRGECVDGDVDDWTERLFPDAEWLCMAAGHPSTARTRKREEWLFNEEQNLIVPSPMTGPTGTGKDGRRTSRCLDNTGPRRWLVIEFDEGTIDEQACLHWHFRVEGFPLVLCVFSGSKSLHGWYRPACEADALAMMKYAVLHGADPATFTRCQLVRRPAAIRENTERVPADSISLPDWEFDGFRWPREFVTRQDVVFYESTHI